MEEAGDIRREYHHSDGAKNACTISPYPSGSNKDKLENTVIGKEDIIADREINGVEVDGNGSQSKDGHRVGARGNTKGRWYPYTSSM